MLGLIPDLIKNQALAKDAYQLLGGLKIENLTHVDAIPEPDPNVRGEIEFNNVSFSYPTDEGNLALKQASFRVGPGEHIALGKFPYLEYASSNFPLWKFNTDAGLILTLFVVGSSGAGKSTILGILLRLYEGVTAGTVTFDGKDIYQVDKQWLRSQMAIVTQEQVLFSGTIKDNIALGNERASMEDIEAAAVVRELDPDPTCTYY